MKTFDFNDAMIELHQGKKVTRKSFTNCYWEKTGVYFKEKFTGDAACGGAIVFKFEDIGQEERDALDWVIYEEQ